MIFGKGFSNEGSILDLAIEYGIVQKSGSWFSYNDERIGQGRETVKNLMNEKPDFKAEIEAKVRALVAEKGGIGFDNPEGESSDEE